MPKKQSSAAAGGAHPIGLEHRTLLNHPPGFHPFSGTDLFERIGGHRTISRLVDLLYDGIADDQQLRPLFPRDLSDGRSMQKLFFAEWLGGPRAYGENAYAGLHQRHSGRPITPALASRWLDQFRRALDATVTSANDRRTIFTQVRSLAMALVNRQQEPRTGPQHVAWCGSGARTVTRATGLARRGDVARLDDALAETPDRPG